MDPLILIAEDETEIAEILDAYLTREGMRTVRATDGRIALDLHTALKPDLVLLDVKLPKLDGWEVLAELRRRGGTPIIMVTALDEDIDKLQALRIGADDYVTKPFNPAEVAARTKAVLRRAVALFDATRLRVEAVEVDLTAHTAIVESKGAVVRLDLTLTEFRILAHMARAPKRVFTRGELLDACLPGSDALERTIDSHISNMRRKLDVAGSVGMLQGVRGVGYRLAPLR